MLGHPHKSHKHDGGCCQDGDAPTLALDSFRTEENISSATTVCPLQNRPLISVLHNLQVVLLVLFSGLFASSIDPFISILEGAARPLELVPADFLRYSVEWVVRKFYRVVRSERASAANEHPALMDPSFCAAYLESLFEKVASDLADHHTRIVDES